MRVYGVCVHEGAWFVHEGSSCVHEGAWCVHTNIYSLHYIMSAPSCACVRVATCLPPVHAWCNMPPPRACVVQSDLKDWALQHAAMSLLKEMLSLLVKAEQAGSRQDRRAADRLQRRCGGGGEGSALDWMSKWKPLYVRVRPHALHATLSVYIYTHNTCPLTCPLRVSLYMHTAHTYMHPATPSCPGPLLHPVTHS